MADEHRTEIKTDSPVAVGGSMMPWMSNLSRTAQMAFQGGPLLIMMIMFPIGLAAWDYRQQQQFNLMREERKDEFGQLRGEIKESRDEARITRQEFTQTLRSIETEFRSSIKDLSTHDATERASSNALMRELIGEVKKLQSKGG